MPFNSNRVLFSLLLIAITQFSDAQSTSPYSRFGLGYLRSNVFSSNKALGEIAAGYRSGAGLNPANPASYSELSFATLEMGANIDISDFKTKDSTYRGAYGTINHIALGFPLIREKLGLSFGLLPYATTNYKFVNQNVDTFSKYTGKGSIYRVYLGSAYQWRGLSVGFNVGYLFGGQDYYKGFEFTDSLNALNQRTNTKMNVHGFVYDLGIQYKVRLAKRSEANHYKNDINLVVGAYGNSQIKVGTTVSGVTERYVSTSSGTAELIDTLLLKKDQKSKIQLPYTVGLGFTVGNEFWWILGADFKYSGWSGFKSPVNDAPLGDSWRFSFGVGITPDYTGKFIKRIQYKAGFYTAQSEVRVNNTGLKEYGGTFGLTLPFIFGRDRLNTNDYLQIHLMGDVGSRIPENKALIRETYYRLTLGVTVNGIWFKKRKFD